MGLQIDKNAQKICFLSPNFLSKNNSFLHFDYWRLKVTQRAANDFAINDFYKSMTSSNNVFISAYVYLKVHTLSNSKC